MITGLMKSERLAADRAKSREQQAAEAVLRLDPPFPYATLPFPDSFGAAEDNEKEL